MLTLEGGMFLWMAERVFKTSFLPGEHSSGIGFASQCSFA